MNVLVDYQPSEKQELFHKTKEDMTVYGGAKGGGKSKGLVMDAFIYALKYPKSNIYLFRETYPMLESTLIAEFKRSVPRELYTFNESKYFAKLINGSIIRFRYISNLSDAESYQGIEMDFIGIDELTKHKKESIQILMSCMRSAKGYPTKFKASCNPGGIGHSWVKEDFIDKTNHGTEVVIDELTGSSIRFIPAKVYDNPVLMKNDPNYVKRLENLPEAQKRAFLNGEWDSFEGQAFSEWDRDIHVVKPFYIPDTWERFRGIDYGRVNPFCCLWGARDHDGNLYVYRELYEPNLDAESQAKMIYNASIGESFKYTVLDTACWAKNHDHTTIADIYSQNGVTCMQASKDRLNGKNIVHKWLKVLDNGNGKKKSRIMFFENCVNIIKTLPSLPMDKVRVEDIDTNAEDHAYDALRYMLMAIGEPVDAGVYFETIRNSQEHLPHALRTDDVVNTYDWYNE